jgi:hypothetical protein
VAFSIFWLATIREKATVVGIPVPGCRLCVTSEFLPDWFGTDARYSSVPLGFEIAAGPTISRHVRATPSRAMTPKLLGDLLALPRAAGRLISRLASRPAEKTLMFVSGREPSGQRPPNSGGATRDGPTTLDDARIGGVSQGVVSSVP